MNAATLLVTLLVQSVDYCEDRPTRGAPASIGRASSGRLEGGVRLSESEALRILPKRHKGRCLDWGTPRLVAALERAGREVRRAHPGSPPLMVGNISRAKGGPIRAYSRSHQAGRDADLAFYQRGGSGPVAAEDLTEFGADLKSGGRKFDVERNWALVRALLEDGSIEVRWMFVSRELKKALLDYARGQKVPAKVLRRASEVLHQPSDAPPHADHFHLRIRCTGAERKRGCVD